MVNKILITLVVISLLVGVATPVNTVAEEDVNIIYDGSNSEITRLFEKTSDYFQYDLEEAYAQNLIPEVFFSEDLTLPVTRGEFAAIAVTLYEKLTGTEVVRSSVPFTDLEYDDKLPYIEKAYALNITTGINETEFAPDSFISREQLAVMLCRVFKKYIYPEWKLADDEKYPLLCGATAIFSDDEQISDYATEAVYFLYMHNVIYGMDDNKFLEAPDADMASREQALALAVRCFLTLFTDEVINEAKMYPEVSETNKIPYIYKFTLNSEEEIEEVKLYDEIMYLKIDSAGISDFSFIKDIKINLIQVLNNGELPFDLNCVNADTIEQLYFYNADLANREAASTFNKLHNFVLKYDRNQPEIHNLDFLSGCSNMKSIEIENCGITNLDFAKNMTQLTFMSVINSALEDINGISNCDNLSLLTLERGKIRDISVIEKLKSLSVLNLGDNYIEDATAVSKLAENWQYVNLSDNFITEISFPDNTVAYKSIFLSRNYISEFPKGLSSDYWIDLSCNNIRELPENVKEELQSGNVRIDLFDNLLDEKSMREISVYNTVLFNDFSADEAIEFSKKMLEILPLFEKGTEYEKVMKITKYVMNNTEEDYSRSAVNKDNAYGALFGEIVCTGSTELTNALCRHTGIKVKSYHGDMWDSYDDARHVWTLVCIDGNYYHCDAIQSKGLRYIYNFPMIVLSADSEITEYNYILDALNTFECNTVIDYTERNKIIDNVRNESA